MIAMLNAGYVIGAYTATFGGVALYTWNLMRRARRAARQVPAEDRPWT